MIVGHSKMLVGERLLIQLIKDRLISSLQLVGLNNASTTYVSSQWSLYVRFHRTSCGQAITKVISKLAKINLAAISKSVKFAEHSVICEITY